MVKKWEIYFVNLDPTKGSDQKGIRPVLVASNDAVNTYLPVCTVIPFSSYKQGTKVYPTEILLKKSETGLDRDSILMFQQIRTIDVSRICHPAVNCIIDENVRARINEGLLEFFDLYL